MGNPVYTGEEQLAIPTVTQVPQQTDDTGTDDNNSNVTITIF